MVGELAMQLLAKRPTKGDSVGFLAEIFFEMLALRTYLYLPRLPGFYKANALRSRRTPFFHVLVILRTSTWAQIFTSIIQPVPIDVINIFALDEGAANNRSHDQAVEIKKRLPRTSLFNRRIAGGCLALGGVFIK